MSSIIAGWNIESCESFYPLRLCARIGYYRVTVGENRDNSGYIKENLKYNHNKEEKKGVWKRRDSMESREVERKVGSAKSLSLHFQTTTFFSQFIQILLLALFPTPKIFSILLRCY